MATPVSSSPAPFDPDMFKELFGKSLNELIEEKLYGFRELYKQVRTIDVLSHDIKLFVEGTIRAAAEKVSWVARIKISFDKYPGCGGLLLLGRGNEPKKRVDLSELKADFDQEFLYKGTLNPEDFPELPITYEEYVKLNRNSSPLWHRVQLRYPKITNPEAYNCFNRVCTVTMHAEVALIKTAKKGGLFNREKMMEAFVCVLPSVKNHFYRDPQTAGTIRKFMEICHDALCKPEQYGEATLAFSLKIAQEARQLQSKKREAASSATTSSDKPGSPKPVTSLA